MRNISKLILALLYFTFLANQTHAQTKRFWDLPLIKKLTSSTKDTTRSASFLALPVLAYSQETGLEYGATGIYNFYVDKRDTGIYTSSINTVATLTSNDQTNIKLEADIWTRDNNYHYIASFRMKDYPFNYYGMGNQTLEADKILLIQKLFQANLEIEKKIVDNYYAGVNVLFEHYEFNKYEEDMSATLPLYGREGGKYLAFGISQLYDTRNSNTETTTGLYGRLKYAYAPNFWKDDNFSGGILLVDARAFFPVYKNITIGIQSIYETLLTSRTPFYMTPQLGNDEMMRGYYQGRYRDKSYLAAQIEARVRIHPRIGLATFIGAGNVYRNTLSLSQTKFSGGGGARYFFDLEHNSSLRLDYAIGEKRPGEKRQGGFYLALGQAF